jgi:hypothetical protein
VAGSLLTGLVVSLLLVAAPFVPAEEATVTGAVLLGFALGYALLSVLSARCTDQAQRWAVFPAAFMGFGGLLLLVFGSAVDPCSAGRGLPPCWRWWYGWPCSPGVTCAVAVDPG